MSATEVQKKARKKYLSEKIDEIKFRVPKGEKDLLRSHAESQGESLNGFLYRAAKEAMERDNQK